MQTFKKTLVILLSLPFLGFTGKEKYIELGSGMNARSSGSFTQRSNNVLFTLGKDTKAEILKHKRFRTGNYGLQVRISSGPHKNKVIWVYHNTKNPTMALYETCPSSWVSSGTSACKTAETPERASASVATKPTPATHNEPEEIPTMPTVNVTVTPEQLAELKKEADALKKQEEDKRRQETVAQPPCTNCSVSPSNAIPTQTFVDQVVAATSKNAITGAYRVMASIYQSCHVLNLPPIHLGRDDEMSRFVQRVSARGQRGKARVVSNGNLENVASSHYYLKDAPASNNPACRDMRDTPPLYYFGGRPTVQNGELNIFAKAPRRGGAQTVGLDCSGFVSSAFTVSGLKLTPSTRSASENVATSASLARFNERNSCFTRPGFTKDQTLMSGDVVAWNGHTFMIDKVGRDPFGIEKAKANGRFPHSISGCSRYQPAKSDLDFTLIQSTGAGNLPAMRIEAKNYGGQSIRSYLNMSIQACRAQFANSEGQTTVVRPGNRTPVALLRHKGSSDPRCSFATNQIPRLAGEQCTQGCFKETL